MKNLGINFYHFLPTHLSTILLRRNGLILKSISKRYCQVVILFSRLFCPALASIDYIFKQKRIWNKSLTLNIKSEQNELSDTQNSVLFALLSKMSILKFHNKEFLKSKSFCPSLDNNHLL